MIKCKDCAYFDTDSNECRVYPPAALGDRMGMDTRGKLSCLGTFPSVDEESWCGMAEECEECDPEDEDTAEIEEVPRNRGN